MTTIAELQAQINSLLGQISIFQSGSGVYSVPPFSIDGENSQIEKHLSEFTNRVGVLLTIATLFTLLPFFDDKLAVSYFLTWVIPFLIISIFLYICSTKRINFLPSLRVKAGLRPLSPWEVNELLVRTYLKARKYHHLTDSVLITFFVSFVLNYYTYFFGGLPTTKYSIVILVTALIAGVVRFRYINTMKTADTTPDPGTLAVGATPPDDTSNPKK